MKSVMSTFISSVWSEKRQGDALLLIIAFETKPHKKRNKHYGSMGKRDQIKNRIGESLRKARIALQS
jgi:hypothetical protein